MASIKHHVKLAVVGAGVIGLSSAYHLADKFKDRASVTVITEKFSPNTTSDKAGSLILPVDFTSVSADEKVRVQQWVLDTFAHFNSLYHSKSADDIKLCVVSGYDLISDKHHPLPWWKDVVFDFRSLSSSSSEVQTINIPPNCHCVWAFSTYVVDCRYYLPWLMHEFIKKGGSVERRKLSTLDELSDYDIVVNCSGLGASELVGDDGLTPVRGQVVSVKSPWIKHFVIGIFDNEDMTYIIPRHNDVVLGGTKQEGNWSETVDPDTTRAIITRCTTLLPSLHGAEVVRAWAGRRPVRKAVRLEREEREKSPMVVVHCYGHGGQGVTLHWGCALDVGRLVESYIIDSATVSTARL